MRSGHLTTTALAVAALVLVGGAPAQAIPDGGDRSSRSPSSSPAVSRVSGSDPYSTSVAASRAAFPPGTRADVVHLVSGTSPWESISATPAAVRQGGAVLLTRPDGIPSSVVAELGRLSPAAIVVVGSTATLSDSVLVQARALAPEVRRVAGSDRYGTSRELVRQAFPPGSSTRAWVATGRAWQDGLVAGAAAAARGEPLLTVDGAASSLPSPTIALVRELGITSVTIAGDPGAVSPGIRAQLTALLGADNVTRASGADRYATAARINALASPGLTAGTAYVTSDRDVASALAGGFLAGRTKRPLFSTLPYCVPDTLRPSLTAASVTRVTLLGGEGSVRRLVGQLEACSSTTAAASPWVLVNKRNALRPTSYVPSGLVRPSVSNPNGALLRSDAAAALARMFSAARSEGAGRMSIVSGYRSSGTQHSLHRNRVTTHGRDYADRWIARPGYSEHQTGLGVDIAPVGDPSCRAHGCIGSTPQGAWLTRNAHRFGFVLRYESGHTAVTGYSGEPWHFRYVGTPLSTAYRAGGWHTLEQFLAEPAAPTY
ncbi:MAG TPA: D-alanyl-D-alanine carboxypeptidase family protein [Ornithinibacter sp.]|nr:D-alanyl-D-alanine carboxypeptidase family protein [Ornithinibacter sp.]